MKNRLLLAVMTLACIAIISACGGGGGGGGSSSTSTTSSGSSISGTASTGAPVVGGAITILSLSNGSFFYSDSKTASDGTFSLTVDSALYPAPYLVRVSSKSSNANYYSYVASNGSSGNIITPISSYALGLAFNKNPDDLFNGTTKISESSFKAAVDLIYTAAKGIFNDKGYANSSDITSNPNYVANGEGQDGIHDILNIVSTSSSSGDILVGTKYLTGAVPLTSSTSASSITPITLSVDLPSSIATQINANNLCIKNAINANSSSALAACLDVNYKDRGNTSAAMLLSEIRSGLPGTLTKINPASIQWCLFDNPALNFKSSAASLAGQSGICYATFDLIAGDTPEYGDGYYKFITDSSGKAVTSAKTYGNQLDDKLIITPAIQKKLRLDGLTNNTGIASGYAFSIGTALSSTTKNLAAKIEIIDSSSNNLGTFYMSCVQGNGCIDSELTMCSSTDADTCKNNAYVDKVNDQILNVSSSLSSAIISAMKTGPVSAKVTTYRDLARTTSNFVKSIPITGTPLSLDDANKIVFPSLSSSTQAALAAWNGGSSIGATFSAGGISLTDVEFWASPNANVNSSNIAVKAGQTTGTFTGISGSGITPIAAGCPQYATWRGSGLSGFYQGRHIYTKYFGSCSPGDY
jgi:hypothetical protein